jgi:hypothetical protein
MAEIFRAYIGPPRDGAVHKLLWKLQAGVLSAQYGVVLLTSQFR